MKSKSSFSIGEVSKICGLSKKALRHYDKVGIIKPDRSCGNNYRYYSRSSLLAVPVIKYYKQMGFKLSEMKEVIESGDYRIMRASFQSKLDELRQVEEEVHRNYTSVKDWYELVVEAESVLHYKVQDISVKFVEDGVYCFLDQDFAYDYRDSIINLEFTNFIESIENEITGPVIIRFPDYKEKMNGNCTHATVLQKALKPFSKDVETRFGGKLMVSAYHIGSHDNINDTYERIARWASENNYTLGPEVYERYVVDYWSSQNTDKFVTEILMNFTAPK
ncbi:MerR family transcriptional regulator [Halodesulfovibrio marinisediminis]|uniref:DNA-binding transcriptional regulator, MerR family n=1 Tax=Halodesulfovibrio marinisediminis DSM 17456 TaxID=1121457 RepID=A0A1N6GYW0_9BACT|nr:MerR family transcriptional regulator [Halodesulfovibrio marinisediminis]SIO12632.1 DNA-binding transcriptional regulator, MerR family [Halodesulfovibrio marinisediminis DSM 17456]